MINNDRIVPVQKIDFLSLIGIVLALCDHDYDVLRPSSIDGEFNVTTGGTLLANQPVKSLDFAENVGAATVYFIAAYDFAGFTIAGKPVAPSDTVKPDGISLYSAELREGKLDILEITPSVAD